MTRNALERGLSALIRDPETQPSRSSRCRTAAPGALGVAGAATAVALAPTRMTAYVRCRYRPDRPEPVSTPHSLPRRGAGGARSVHPRQRHRAAACGAKDW